MKSYTRFASFLFPLVSPCAHAIFFFLESTLALYYLVFVWLVSSRHLESVEYGYLLSALASIVP
jgi:hypothetical protein